MEMMNVTESSFPDVGFNEVVKLGMVYVEFDR